MKFLFLPIDIDLSTLAFQQLDSSTIRKAFNPYWNSAAITEDTVIATKFDKILEQLPFECITTLTHKTQNSAVARHVDVYPSMIFEDGEFENILDNEPAGYRIVIHGSNESLEIFNNKEWVTARLPAVPCCYLLNSTSAYHRVKADPNREIIYIRGFLNPEQHKALIEKSYLKYKDYAIALL